MQNQKRSLLPIAIDRPGRIFDPCQDTSLALVVCPVCGCEHVISLPHFPRVGSDLLCGFECEEGHRFGIAIRCRKGVSVISLNRLPDVSPKGTPPELDPLNIIVYAMALEADNECLRDELARVTTGA